jgi:glycosyltransferase involved in cell wall biosynthesis
MSLLKKAKLELADRAKYSPSSRVLLSRVLEAVDKVSSKSDPTGKVESIKRLTLAARLGHGRRSVDRLESELRDRIDSWDLTKFDWNLNFPGSGEAKVERSIILKAPGPSGEKGVLFVAFEDNWLRLLRQVNVSLLASQYHLIIAPTWSPPHDLPLLAAIKLWPGTLYTIMSAVEDAPIFEHLSERLIAIPLLSSSWVNPRTFSPIGDNTKKYDIVMVSNFARYKRHFALFRALREMDPRTRVALIGVRLEGRTPDDLMGEAAMYGVADRIQIMERIPDAEMIKTIHASKVSVIMSKGEGSCVAVAESLFADIPVGLIEGANVGSRSFINSQTGRFLRDDHLAEDLTDFIAHHNDYHPRQWMLENGKSFNESSVMLNDVVKATSIGRGEPWTADLQAFHWRPYPMFLHRNQLDAVLPEYERFQKTFGIPLTYLEPREV